MEFDWSLVWKVPVAAIIVWGFLKSQVLIIGSKAGKTTSVLAHDDRKPPPSA